MEIKVAVTDATQLETPAIVMYNISKYQHGHGGRNICLRLKHWDMSASTRKT